MRNFVVRRDAEVTKDFTIEDLNKWQEECYFRFQCIDWEVGEKSFGMIYTSPEEAIDNGSTVLDGKSCCGDWRELERHLDSFGGGEKDFCILVFKGAHNGRGHDEEDVVIPKEFVKALDYRQFLDCLGEELDNEYY